MVNVVTSLGGPKGTILTITVDLEQDQGPSKSGKTTIIATSSGIVEIPGAPDPSMKFGLNVFKAIENRLPRA